jgi:hypothetical protein
MADDLSRAGIVKVKRFLPVRRDESAVYIDFVDLTHAWPTYPLMTNR